MMMSLKGKFIAFLVVLISIICIVFFAVTYTSGKQSSEVDNADRKQAEVRNISFMEDLTTCRNDLFVAKNKIKQLEVAPDVRKDIVSLLVLVREFEKDIGVKEDLSDYCVKMFTISARIPIVQEYMSLFKKKMFENECRFQINKTMLDMAKTIREDKIEMDYNNKTKKDVSFLKRKYYRIKSRIAMLFMNDEDKKSDIEIAIENRNYELALEMMNSDKLYENKEKYGRLYDSIRELRDMKQMVDGIYEIVANTNR